VGDEDHSQAEAIPQAADQAQDLGLDGHVQGRRGLVGDQQVRPAGQGQGQDRALAHPARELVGITAQRLGRRGHPHQAQGLGRLGQRRRPGETTVVGDHLGDQASHSEHGVEGRHGLLVHHGDPAPPDPFHGLLGQGQQVVPLEEDPPAHDAAGGVRHQAHKGEGGYRLAAAGLPHQAQDLAPL
jgi:hypothetical protein